MLMRITCFTEQVTDQMDHNKKWNSRPTKDHTRTELHMYLHPGLARHFSLLNLVVGDWTSSVMFWSLPHQVDMVSGYFSHLKVFGSTGACWENKGAISSG